MPEKVKRGEGNLHRRQGGIFGYLSQKRRTPARVSSYSGAVRNGVGVASCGASDSGVIRPNEGIGLVHGRTLLRIGVGKGAQSTASCDGGDYAGECDPLGVFSGNDGHETGLRSKRLMLRVVFFEAAVTGSHGRIKGNSVGSRTRSAAAAIPTLRHTRCRRALAWFYFL